MNFKKYILPLIFLYLAGLSCSDEFLEVENINQLSASSFYKTADDFERLGITCYMPMAFADFYGNSYHVLNFALDDRVIHERFSVQNLQFNSTETLVEAIYYGIYTGVYRCNLFFQKFSPEIAMDPERRNQLTGEVHFMRGFYYFHAAFLFEVSPLLKEPYVPNTYYPNSVQDSLYNFAEEELKRAVDLLPESWPDDQVGRATKGSALGFLGKLYLFRKNWEGAVNAFQQLINLGVYELTKPVANDSLDYVWAYLANFSKVDLITSNGAYKAENNKESVFEVQYSNKYVDVGRAGLYLPGRRGTGSSITWFNSYINGYKNISMDDDKFPAEFETPLSHPAGLKKDPRYYASFLWVGDTLDYRIESPLYGQVLLESQLNSSLGSKAGPRKFFYPFHILAYYSQAPYMDPTNWRIMRYADVLLMYAEARYRSTGNSSDAEGLSALNEVRSRAGLDPVTALSKDVIMHERDVELACEQHRYWDLVRWYQSGWLTLEEIRKYKPYFQPKHVCLPIPLNEINDMKGVLKQNPKWLN